MPAGAIYFLCIFSWTLFCSLSLSEWEPLPYRSWVLSSTFPALSSPAQHQGGAEDLGSGGTHSISLHQQIQLLQINTVYGHHLRLKTQHFLSVKTVLSCLIVLWLPEHLPCEDINYPGIKRPSFLSVRRELFSLFFFFPLSFFYSFQLNRSCLEKREKMGLNAN